MNDKTKDMKDGGIADDVAPQATADRSDTPVSDNAQYNIAGIGNVKDEAVEAAPAPAADDTTDADANTYSSASANASLSADNGLGATSTSSSAAVNAETEKKPEKKKAEIKLDAASLRAVGGAVTKQFLRYAPILFFVLVAMAYGFIVLRINTLSNAQPSQSDIDAQTTTTPIPRIDPNTVKRLENLEDNSQNVQTLFDEARKNPFN